MKRKAALAAILGITSLLAIISLAFGLPDASDLPNFKTSLFAGSYRCGVCHSDVEDNNGNDISIDTLWRSSSMANAGKDPFMIAKLESEIARTPAMEEGLEATCPICHQPMARTQAHADETTVALLGDGFLNPANPLHLAAMDGISCTFCHQITEENLGEPASFSGNYVIDTVVEKPERLLYGKYPNPAAITMDDYKPQQGLHEEDSGICAVCHEQHVTPTDAEGNALPVSHPEQKPYAEWENSIYGNGDGYDDETCQDCHMPVIEGAVNLTNDADNPRTDLKKHTFEGGNTMILAMFRDHADDLGVTATADQMNESIALTQTLLQNETAELTIDKAQIINGVANIDIAINNLVGHKFPTGVPFRRAWVHLKVTDLFGNIQFESGKPLPTGQIMGNAADFDLSAYEPHYDLITQENQVQIYEPITKGPDGELTYTILRVVGFEKDNRLLPKGFDKQSAPADIAVVGNAASDIDFNGGGDVIHYQIPILDGTYKPIVTAELLFQPISYPAVQDLLADLPEAAAPQGDQQVTGTYINRFVEYYAAADKTPELVVSTSKSLETPTAITLQQMTGQELTSVHLLMSILFLVIGITAAALVIQRRYR